MTEAREQSTAAAAAAHPLVQGRCPACGGASLFLGSGGYLTCARLDCPQPDAATEVIADFWEARQHGAFTFCPQDIGHVTMAEFARKISEKRTALAQREEAVRYANEQKQRAEQAEAERDQLRHVRSVAGIHFRAIGHHLNDAGIRLPDNVFLLCALLDDELTLTLEALAEQHPAVLTAPAEGGPGVAATEAAELETTARVFAALHRSAEEEVSRVIALYTRWVKAGPPPLGTSIARWWDPRLVELHDAILPPDPPSPATTEATNRPT